MSNGKPSAHVRPPRFTHAELTSLCELAVHTPPSGMANPDAFLAAAGKLVRYMRTHAELSALAIDPDPPETRGQ